MSTHLNRTRLIRSLAGIVEANVPPAGPVTERLGQWLSVGDAIDLHGVLSRRPKNTPTDTPADNAAARTIDPRRLRNDLDNVRRTLTDAFLAVDLVKLLTHGRLTRNGLAPAPIQPTQPGLPDAPADVANTAAPAVDTPPPPREIDVDFTPVRHFLMTQQRNMGTSLLLLRRRVRDALARQTPALRHLAALDLALDTPLSHHERDLLGTIPVLLERHFDQARARHLADVAPGPDDACQWIAPNGWLTRFCTLLRDTLQQELDLRLQPVIGLIEAAEQAAP